MNMFAELNLVVLKRIAKLPNLIPHQIFRLYDRLKRDDNVGPV